MNPWLVIPIIVADWVIMILVGGLVSHKLQKTAYEAVKNGAEDVKKHLLGFIPMMLPTLTKTVGEVIRAEIHNESGADKELEEIITHTTAK